MPVVIVKTLEGVTPQQKSQLIEKITGLMGSVLGKNPATTHVIVEEISADNWGLQGKPVAAIRAGR